MTTRLQHLKTLLSKRWGYTTENVTTRIKQMGFIV